MCAAQISFDVANLTQMIAKAGAEGLKQMALANVDPHTIGYLLALGELAPISVEFRRQMSVCRRKQRKSRSWIYKTIEIGAATNFLADELLKSRAGENVLALLTSVMPLLSENALTDLLLTLCSSGNAAVSSIPGIGQLQRLRTALLPFVNAMDVKNKVMQYHIAFRIHGKGSYEPHHAIPQVEIMSTLVHAFRKMVLSDVHRRIVFKGVEGAAWTAMYAMDMLGLTACMMIPDRTGMKCIPINAMYEDAKVVFELAAPPGAFEIWKLEKVKELIQSNFTTQAVDIEWTIDCNHINYLLAHHPIIQESQLYMKVSEFVAAKTLDCTAELSRDLSYSVNNQQPDIRLPHGLRTLQRSSLPSVQQRSLRILEILGFGPPSLESFEFSQSGHSIGRRRTFSSFSFGRKDTSDQEDSRVGLDYWQTSRTHGGEKWWSPQLERGFGAFVRDWNLDFQGQARPPVDVAAILITVKNAILFAAHMAFTDWHLTLKCISADFFTNVVLFSGGASGNINARNNIKKMQQFITAHPLPEPLFWSFGQEISGVIILRQIPLIQNIHELDGILFSIRPGKILFEGERCDEICSTQSQGKSAWSGMRGRAPRFEPYDLRPFVQLSTACRYANGKVFVGFEIAQHELDDDVRSVQPPEPIKIDPEQVAETLSGLLVTAPCGHDYREILPEKLRDQHTWHEGFLHRAGTSTSERIPETQFLEQAQTREPALTGSAHDLPARESYSVYYQAVDKNGLGQWLACHLSPSRNLIFILQFEACLKCTLSQVDELKLMNEKLRRKDVCIIAGGRPEQSRRPSMHETYRRSFGDAMEQDFAPAVV